MAKYKLLAQHFSEEDKLLEPGTEVGDGTEHKWSRPPTVEMEPLDEDGKQRLERERTRVGDRSDPLDGLPATMGEAEPPPRRRQRSQAQPEPQPQETAAEEPPD